MYGDQRKKDGSGSRPGQVLVGVGPRLLREPGKVAIQSHLEVAVDQKVGLKVIVVLSEGIDELLGYLKGEGMVR